jgi:arabinose-5-phosphate isomerase
VFTDSDLARLLETRQYDYIDRPVCEVMTRSPKHIDSGSSMAVALDVLADRKISELPVVDAAGRPIGLIDITDVVGLLPREASPENAMPPAVPDNSPSPETVPFAG